MTNATGSRGGPRTAEPARHRRHRVHRVRHVEAAGARRRAGDDGIPADRAPPLARGRALPAGHDEHHRQRAARRRPAHRAAGRAADHQRVRRARARRRRRVPPRARSRRVGDSRARAGDGAQHPRDPRRRREPHLLRRPLRRVLDLRRRLPRHPDGRPASAGARRHALLRHRPVHRRRPHRRLGRVLLADLRLPAAAGRGALRHHAQGPAAAEPVPRASTCS